MAKDANKGTSRAWQRKLGFSKEDPFHGFIGRKTDHVILVMGSTGAGKSTFIREYTGNPLVAAPNQLVSCTQGVTCYEAPKPGQWPGMLGDDRLILVDTPGFDDTYKGSSDILRIVSGWLAKSYNDDIPISGIIYIYDISQVRMRGSAIADLKTFQTLCGDDCYKKVVIATSQWDLVQDKGAGAQREQNLTERFWKSLVDGGATVMRVQEAKHRDAVIDRLLKVSIDEIGYTEGADKNILKIQEELVDLERSLPATKAGQELKLTLEELLTRLGTANTLTQRERVVLQRDIRALKLSLRDRFRKFFGLL